MNIRKTLLQPFKIAAVILVAVLLASCEDFLTENPQSSAGVSTFYKTQDDFQQAVNAIYGNVNGLYNGNQAYILNDLRSDNIVGGLGVGGTYDSNGDQEPIDKFRINSSNNTLQPLWGTQYNGIARANRVITYIKDMSFDKKGELMGQAKALRALFYFNLVREFGKVQLVTKPDIDINTDRVSLDSVYAQIITDLQDAAESLPATYAGADDGRITKGAAQSLLGTVYLTRKNFSAAATAFEEVVNSGSYSLRDNYGDLWTDEGQGQGSESIWRVLYRADEKSNGSKYPNWYAPDVPNALESLLGPSKGTAFGFFIPTVDLTQAYSDNDERRKCIADGFNDVTDNTFTPVRYVKCYVQQTTISGGKSSSADWYIIRYANVLLRYAEALNEMNQGDPLQYVNMVRNRAGLTNITVSSQSAIRDAIYKEQRLESPFEGHRWNNLVRTGRAVSIMNSKIASDTTSVGPTVQVDEHQILYPIPNRVITNSGIEQNPGY